MASTICSAQGSFIYQIDGQKEWPLHLGDVVPLAEPKNRPTSNEDF